MTKYTDEEIIAYLKTLREGDVLTAVKSFNEASVFKSGRRYEVRADMAGDLFVYCDSRHSKHFVNIGVDYGRYVASIFSRGIFEIPAPATVDKPFLIDISSYTVSPYNGTYSIEIQADGAGLAQLFELEARGNTSRNLAALYAKRAELQVEIDRLEAK
ncbi:hypothetical protein [Sporosarcina psychrophila]|uniref:DUF4304 domain-containing protein n=1 Tax=Sporosarcina psychrophila TaxID=1476 RepID=A0ABV2KEG4_SPOPS